MAFLINWLAAIGALVILGLIYNNAVLINPQMAALMSITALVFLTLANVVRVNAMKLLHLSHGQALAGLLVVLTIIGFSIYFAIPQIERFTYNGQYVALAWMGLLDLLLLGESLLSFRNVARPALEEKLRRIEKARNRRMGTSLK